MVIFINYKHSHSVCIVFLTIFNAPRHGYLRNIRPLSVGIVEWSHIECLQPLFDTTPIRYCSYTHKHNYIKNYWIAMDFLPLHIRVK